MRALAIIADRSECEHIQNLLNDVQTPPFVMDCCHTLVTGMDALRAGSYEVVILDMELPDNPGLGAFNQLHTQFPQIPVVLLAGHSDEEQALEGIRGGAQDYLPRAEITNRALLVRTIRYAVERHQGQLAQHLSEARYRAIVEDQTELICRYAPDFTLTFVNRAYANRWGMTPQALIGSNFFSRIPPEDHAGALAHVRSLSTEHPVAQTEHRSVSADQSIRWEQWSDRAIFDPTGQVIEYQGVGRDITEQVELQTRLQAALERYAVITASMTDALLVVNLPDDGSSPPLIEVNQTTCRYLGYTRDELLNMTLTDIDEPDSGIDVPRTIEQLKNVETLTFEQIHRTKTGERVPVEIHARYMILDGKPSIIAVVRDITRRKQIQSRLKLLEAAVQYAGDGIAITDGNIGERGPTLIYVNPAFTRVTGWKPEQVLGKPVSIMIHEAVSLINAEQLIEGFSAQQVFPVRSHTNHKHSNPLDIAGTISPIKDESGAVTHYVAVLHDITDEEQMRRLQQATLDSIGSHLAVLEPDGTIAHVNEAWRRFGSQNGAPSESTYLNANYLTVCDQAQGDEAQTAALAATGIRAVIAGELDVFYQEYAINLGQHMRWFGMQVTPFNEPVPRRVVVSHTDISRRMAAEEALQKANDSLEQRVASRTAELNRITTRIEAIFDSSSDGIVLYDLRHGIQQGNRTFNRLFGYVDESYLGLPLTMLAQPEDIPTLEAALQRVIEGSSIERVEMRARYRDGTPLEVEIGISLVRYADHPGHHLVCTFRDIRERKRIQRSIDEERNLLRTLIDAIPDFIYVKDTQHRILLDNASHSRVLQSREGLDPLGKTDLDFFPQEMAQKYHADEAVLFRTGQPLIGVEERTVGINGSLIWVLTTKIPLRNLNGEIIGLVGITHDISEQKRQQEILHQSREQVRQAQKILEEVLDTIPVRVFWKDQRSIYMGCNRLFAADAGLKNKEAIVGKSDRHLPWLTDQAEKYITEDAQVMRGDSPKLDYEEPLLTADGRALIVQTSKLPLHNTEGMVIGVLGIYLDITAHKQAEEEIRRHQADLHSIIDSTPLAFVLVDQEGIIRTHNQFAQALVKQQYGTTLAPGRGILECLPQAAHKRFQDRLVRVLAGESFAVDEVVWDGDQQHFLEFRYYPVKTSEGEMIGANLTFEDITARKEIEQQLLYNASLQETVSDAVIATDMEYRIQSWNKAAERIYGWTAAEVLGKHLGQLLAPEYESNQNALSIVQEMIDRGFWSGESKQCRRDQTWLHILGSLVLLRGKRGAPMGIVSVNHDITDRKQAEIAMKALTQRLEMAALSGRIGIWEWDIKTDQVIWDERMYMIYGMLPRPIFGPSAELTKLIYPDDVQRTQDETEAALQGDKPYDTTFRILRPDKTVRYVKANAIVLRHDDGHPERMIGVNWDMTQIKQSEEALREALEREKELNELKSRFVSTASHEFRTPLATILATTETLVAYRHRMSDSDVELRLQKIRTQIAHLRSIMDDVLQLSRIQAGRISITLTEGDFDAFCRSIIEEFESHPHTQQKIVYTCSPQPLILRFDLNLMRHVISNLISNALKYTLDHKDVFVNVSLQSGTVILQVRDQGIGIPSQAIPHLFEPFHRAANVGTIPGTGLGLPISKNAVEMHGGTIEVVSDLGQGSTFTVKIPLVVQPPPDDDPTTV